MKNQAGGCTSDKRFALVAESGADIEKKYVEEYGLTIVPMYVTMGEQTKKDGSFPVTDLYSYYERTRKLPQTSAPNPQDYKDAYERIHEEYPEAHILHLGYSAVTSCSFQNAVLAKGEMPFVTNVDSKSVTGAQAAVVLRTARYLENHPEAGLEEVLAAVNTWISKAKMVFVPGDLKYLRAGGRVSNAAYLGAAVLSIKPLIEIENGYLVSTKKYRGRMEKVIKRVIQDFFEKYGPDPKEIYVLWSEGFDHSMDAMVESELKAFGADSAAWFKTGTVITTHCGPGAFGLVGFSK